MTMETTLDMLGYVGYGLLCVFAFMWALGVRCVLTATIPVIAGSLTFVAAALVLPVTGASLLHAWWIIPATFGVIRYAYVPIMVNRVPVLWPILHTAGSLYAGILRVGIKPERIDAAYDAQFRSVLQARNSNEAEMEQSMQRYARWKQLRSGNQ